MHDGTDGEQHDRTAMATTDRTSPPMFQGLSWDEWADTVAQKGEKDAAEDDEESQEVSGGEGSQRHNDNCHVMRLKREDSNVFGICPTQDEFYLVVCEQCGQVVKPQAIETHIEKRHGRPPGKPPDEVKPKPSVMHSQPEISPLILKRLTAALQHSDNAVHPEPLNSSEQQALQEEQDIAIDSIRVEAQGPPEIEQQAQIVSHLSHQGSPLEDTPAPTLQNVQETEVQQGGLLPQDQHDVPPTLQNELPMHHHNNDERVRPVLNPVSPSITTGVHHRTPSPMESLMDPTIAIPPQLLVKPDAVSSSLVKAHQLNVPINHKVSTSGSKKSKKAPSLACLKIKNGGAKEEPKKKPTKKSLPSPRKPRSGDSIPCKDREYDANKHCGVWVDDTQRQCTRSLTCKTHALGLRRKVTGRRKPFDELLKDHKAAKEALMAEKRAMVAAQEAAKNAAKGITVTTAGTTLTIPTTSLANIQPAKANTVLVAPTLMNTHSLSHQSEKSKGMHKIAAATIAAKPLSINIVNSVLPIMRPPCTPPITPSLTLPENFMAEPSTPVTPKPMIDVAGQRVGEGCQEPVDRGGGSTKPPTTTTQRLESSSCLQCHPRPASMCTFGTRQIGKGIHMYNRKLDYLRSTVTALVERHLRPPPLKKMCIAGDSRHFMSTPTMTTTTSVSNMQSVTNTTTTFISRPSTCTAGSSMSTLTTGAARVTPAATVRVSATGAKVIAKSTSATSKSSSLVHNSVSKGQSSGKKSSVKQTGASKTAKTIGSIGVPQKTTKARRKSGGGAGKAQLNRTNASSSVVQNVFSVSSANPVVTLSSAPVSTGYSLVTNSGLQAADLVGSGIVGIDASGNITDANLLKNLQFVVTSVEGSVNGGGTATGTIMTNPTSGTITVPILSTTMGTTPVLLSNLGHLALPHDGKMNIKSRPVVTGAGAAAMSKSKRKHSGGAVAQTLTVAPQSIMLDNYTQDKTSGTVSSGVILTQPAPSPVSSSVASPMIRPVSARQSVMLDNYTQDKTSGTVSSGVILTQPAPSPVSSSVASPMIRPSSSSPQLASPLPNGIIPSPTVAIKPFPSTAVAVNHVQSAISPSRNSTPSPGGSGSAEASPCSGVVSHQTFIGVNQAGKGGAARSGAHKSRKQQLTPQQPVAPAPTQVHHLPFTTQQLLTNIVATRDAQGKIVPLNSALLQNHQIFNSIPVQQAPTGNTAAAGTAVMQGSLTVTTAMEQGSKGTPPPPPPQTVLPQTIALTLQQQHHHQGQPIRLQTTAQGLTDQSQVVLSPSEDTRHELQMQH